MGRAGDDLDGPVVEDILHYDDVIVDGSLCVGFDCVNGESFGFDTIRVKENNTRIRFYDTSTSASLSCGTISKSMCSARPNSCKPS